MPGPGSKQKSKQKPQKLPAPKQSVSTSKEVALRDPSSDLAQEVAGATGWVAIEDVLIKLLGLPEINTRRGLNAVHKNFDKVTQKLDEAYNHFLSDDRITAGIVGIYTQMCADAKLKDRLIKERDLISKIFTLIERPEVCLEAIQCLSAITHHIGVDIRIDICQKMPVLLQLLEQRPTNPKVVELTVAVISHSAAAVLDTSKTPNQKLLELIEVPRLISSLIAHMKEPTCMNLLLGHASEFFMYSPWTCAKEVLDNPSAMNFLVALTRSKDFELRFAGIVGLIRVCMYNNEPEDLVMDPYRVMTAFSSGVPLHLRDAMSNYGSQRCDMAMMQMTSHNYHQAMMELVDDHDFVKLGRLLAGIILATEFSVADGIFQLQLHNGEIIPDSEGLPFHSYFDAFPSCVDALRKSGNADDKDYADIVELKYLLVRRRHTEARIRARTASARNPRVGYFYYVQTLGAKDVEGLQIAKKGLKCPNLTNFVRFALMYRSAEHAISLGVGTLQGARVYEKTWNEGIAYLFSAYEDVKTFVEEAPPDGRSMCSVLYYHAILTMLLKGSEISPDMSELKENAQKLSLTDEFTRFLGRRISATQMRLVRNALFERMPTAWTEWGTVIDRYDATEGVDMVKALGQDSTSEGGTNPVNTGLEEWFAKMDLGADGYKNHDHHHDTHHNRGSQKLDDIPLHPGARHYRGRVRSEVNRNTVELYRCTWCKNPSADLHKCGSCKKTRYCDATCQKLHWTNGHKKECKKVVNM